MAQPARYASKTLQKSFKHMEMDVGRPRNAPSLIKEKGRFIHPRDRIRMWPVAPGDRVAVYRYMNVPYHLRRQPLPEAVNTDDWVFTEVESVFRTYNKLYVKDEQFKTKKAAPSGYPGHHTDPSYKPEYTYSNKKVDLKHVRLLVEYNGQDHVASEIKMGAPRWCTEREAYVANREAYVADLDQWFTVDWPIPEKETYIDAEHCQKAEKVNERTFQTPLIEEVKKLIATPAEKAQTRRERFAGFFPELAIPEIDFTGGSNTRANQTKRHNKRLIAGLVSKINGPKTQSQ